MIALSVLPINVARAKTTMATSLPGIKDSLKLPFRTIRIGTLRTFPAKDKDDNNEPMVLSDKGLTFPVSLRQGEKTVYFLLLLSLVTRSGT